MVMRLFPIYVGSRLRTQLLRMIGFDFGAGTVIWGKLQLVGPAPLTEQLNVGEECWINTECYFELGEKITIGDRVSIGQQVMILTNSHHIGDEIRRAGSLQSKPVSVGNGAWLSTRCTILPGVTIGEGSIVAAGAIVTKSVPPHVMVAGVPAKILRELPTNLSQDAKSDLATTAFESPSNAEVPVAVVEPVAQ